MKLVCIVLFWMGWVHAFEWFSYQNKEIPNPQKWEMGKKEEEKEGKGDHEVQWGEEKMGFAGRIPISRGEMFYWYVPYAYSTRGYTEKQREKAPLVIWMNGGPGCSSMYGMFLENGPIRVKGENVTMNNPHSWDKAGHVMFVDQPVGTGFSTFTSLAKKDQEYASDFEQFLRGVLYKYPILKDAPIYLTGESYAGRYVPVIAKYLIEREWNIKGVLLGNPWSDPTTQYASYPMFVHEHGFISTEKRDSLVQKYQSCVSTKTCDKLMEEVMQEAHITNYYDIRDSTNPEKYPSEMSDVITFLNRPNIQKSIHVSMQTFVPCVQNVYSALEPLQYRSVQKEFSYLLDHKIRVIIFSGEFDLICNRYGSMKTVESISWSGQEKFLLSNETNWNHDGTIRSHGLLTHITIRDAGHMALFSQPHIGIKLLHLLYK